MIKVISLWILFVVGAHAQNIQAITVTGLKHTHERYLKQFIQSEVGHSFDSLTAEADRQRLANLEIMQQVVLTLQASINGITLNFQCTEMIPTIPIFGLGQTRNTFWCRAGIQHSNLSHRGDKLIAYYQYYDRHSSFLSYTMPRLQDRLIGFSGTLVKWGTLEPLTIGESVLEYGYDNLTLGLASIFNLNYRESIEVGLQSLKETYTLTGNSVEPSAPNNLARQGGLIKVIFRSNRINFSSFYQQGFYNQINIELIKRTEDAGLFFIAFQDLKYFQRVGKHGNIATRLRMGLSSNEANPFAPFVLDSFINIRGVGNRVDRGTGSLVINAEYRQTIMNLPVIAAQAVAFMDFGTWRKPGGTMNDFTKSTNMKALTGVGLRLIYKRAFDTMLRVDYGFDYNQKRGLVLGIGQYF